MVIFPLAPDQTIAQMWSNGARGGMCYNVTTDPGSGITGGPRSFRSFFW